MTERTHVPRRTYLFLLTSLTPLFDIFVRLLSLTCLTYPQCMLLPCILPYSPSPLSPDEFDIHCLLIMSLTEIFSQLFLIFIFSLSLYCCFTSFPFELMSQVTTWAPNLANLWISNELWSYVSGQKYQTGL